MALCIGIVGLPNVGKSTLFNALAASSALAESFPFCTIEPNVGVVPVPDPRLAVVARAYGSQRSVPTALEFVDIAGLVRGASTGEGLGNQFLAHIRQVDAILHVVRCFEDENVAHVHGKVDPREDVEVVETELALRDLETVDNRSERAQRQAKAAGKPGALAQAELSILETLRDHLSAGRAIRTLVLDPETQALVRELCLLTAKPLLFVANLAESQLAAADAEPAMQRLKQLAQSRGDNVVAIGAAIEAEVAQLPQEEQGEFLESLGLAEPSLHRFIRASYNMLDLLTFITANDNEAHGWTLSRGCSALDAAAKVHTDFAKGFIRAEVIRYADLERLGSDAAVKQAGLMKVEGKTYPVQDGDILFFKV